MSLVAPKFKDSQIAVAVDPRVNFMEDPMYIVNGAGQRILYRNYTSSNYSAGEIIISTRQSRDVSISTKVFMHVTFDITFSGIPVNGQTLLQLGSNDAPRFMPLHAITKTITVDMNSESFTTTINDYFDALMRYNNTDDEMGYDFSGTPAFMDTYQNYSDFVQYGSALNALGQHGENSRLEPLRGGFRLRNVVNPVGNGVDPVVASVRLEVVEPLLLSPFVWGHNNTKSFIGIDSLDITYTFDTSLDRIWSHSSLNSAANFTVTSVMPIENPSAEFVYITPKKIMPIDPIQRYPYYNVQKYSQTSISAPPNGLFTFNSDNISLVGVPKRIYLFARRSNATRNVNTTDTYATLLNLNVTFNNDDGIFAQATPQQLFRISRENGYRGSWEAWQYYEGSVFCMDFAKDVPLLNTEGVGSLENIQFQFEAMFQNVNQSDTIDFTLFTVIIYEGLLIITANGEINKVINIVAPDDLLRTDYVQKLPYHPMDNYLAGGGFGSRIKSVASKAVDVGKKAVHGAKKLYDAIPEGIKKDIKSVAKGTLEAVSPRIAALAETYGPAVVDVAKSLAGSGYTENQIYKVIVKKIELGHLDDSASGAGLVMRKSGGKKLTAAQLEKLARLM